MLCAVNPGSVIRAFAGSRYDALTAIT